jgi:hypothetical protein
LAFGVDATTPSGRPAGVVPCAPLEQLVAAFGLTYGEDFVLGYGLRDVRCAGRWATAWTDPPANDPDFSDPAPILFERVDGGSWRAVGAGEDNGCLRDVPQELWDALACF